MKKLILVAIVYIIIFAMEILAYYISKENAIFIYGFITLISFISTFTISLVYNDQNIFMKQTKIIKIKVRNRVYTMSEDDFIKLKKFRQNENS